MKYPCSQCKLECREFCIECRGCEKWTHFQCIPGMTKQMQIRWTSPLLNFYCSKCCNENNVFSIKKSLKRIKQFIDRNKLSPKLCWGIAEQEKLLAEIYGVSLLPLFQFPSSYNTSIDKVTVEILKQLSPITLQTHVPKCIPADGNCFYRAISYALFGTDDLHLNIRLAVVLEMFDNPTFYDINHPKYDDLIKDFRIISPSFEDLCNSIVTPGSYADMICIFAASSVISKPIQSFMPSVGVADERCTAYTKKVVGRRANQRQTAAFVLMWTSTIPLNIRKFDPNHFVLLEKSTKVANDVIPTSAINSEVYKHLSDDKYNNLNDINFDDCLSDDSTDLANPTGTAQILLTSSSDDDSAQTCHDVLMEFSPLVDHEFDDCLPDIRKSVKSAKFRYPKFDKGIAKEAIDSVSKVESPAEDTENISNTGSYLTSDDEARLNFLNELPVLQTVDDKIHDCLPDISKESSKINHPQFDEIAEAVSGLISLKNLMFCGKDCDPRKNEDQKNTLNSINEKKSSSTALEDFLPTNKLIKVLTKNDKELVCPSIPTGIKENEYFVVQNLINRERLKQGLKQRFIDDCGVWIKSAYFKSYYLRKNMKQIYLFKKKLCWRNSGKYKTIVPQPNQSDVIAVVRYSSKNKNNSNYQRRVSWLESCGTDTYPSIVVVEYKGKFPGHIPHGNSIANVNDYVRTASEVLDEIACQVPFVPPKNIYDKFLQNAEDITVTPRNLKQLYNKKYNEKKDNLQAGNQSKRLYNTTYGDEVLQVISMVQTEPFVRKIIHCKNEPVSVILYDNRQIQDVKRFCISGNAVLCVDKTYNLGRVFVTVTVFKNLSVLRQNNKHPLFLGPVFLHGKSDCKTYYEFFNCLSFELKVASYSHFAIGTDDEQALHQAILKAFPDCQHVLCVRHLKENLQHYLSNKIGAKLDMRNSITNLVFSLLKSKDDVEFEAKKEEVLEKCKSNCANIVPYLTSRLLPLLTEKVWNKRHVVPLKWNNNYAESINHVLKCKTNWKQISMPKLIQLLHEEVTSQYTDVERAIIKLGPFKLSDHYEKFQLTYTQWTSKSPKEREKHVHAFMSKFIMVKHEGVSSDFTLTTFLPSSNCGKKPNQKKRRRAERSSTYKK